MKKDADYSPDWHDTCVSSLACVFINGVTKTAKLIVLQSSTDLRDTFWAFTKTLELSHLRGANKTVIMYTASAPSNHGGRHHWMRIQQIMKDLVAFDIVIIVSAGNYARTIWRGKRERSDIDTVPAIWSSQELPLIVVRAVDSSRSAARFTQGPVIVYELGVDVRCAGNLSGMLSLNAKASGMSYAAAMVSLGCFQTHGFTNYS